MSKIKPTFILVRPQLPENIGMTARVMDNFGLKNLYIVNPRDQWPNKKAIDTAKHAGLILEKAKLFDNLEDAVSDYNLIVGTSNRNRFLTKKSEIKFSYFIEKLKYAKKTAVLFGPESSGLSNKDLRLVNFIFTIPTSNSNKSLNLSHSVALISHEIFQSNKNDFSELKKNIVEKITKNEFQQFMQNLISDLENGGFFHPKEKKDNMIDHIYSIYDNLDLTKKDLRILWGIHKNLKNWPKT